VANSKIAFIVTKPLQLLVSLTIYREYCKGHRATFFIIDSFFEANVIADRIGQFMSKEIDCKFHKTKKDAYIEVVSHSYNQIFIDSDVGFQNCLWLKFLKIFNKSLKINIFEEGNGTYSNELYVGIKKKILKLMRISVFFGDCPVTSQIYLYNANDYLKKFPYTKDKLVQINTNITEFIRSNFTDIATIFGTSDNDFFKSEKRCRIYLTDWNVDYKFIDDFLNLNGDLFIKPHPHLTENFSEFNLNVMQPGAPFELLIVYFLDIYERIDVYDSGSAARRYINDPKVRFHSIYNNDAV
jgi:hypothetical protein